MTGRLRSTPPPIDPERDFATPQAAYEAGFSRGYSWHPVLVEVPEHLRPRRTSRSRRIDYESGLFDGWKARRRRRRLYDKFAAGKMSKRQFDAHRSEILDSITYENTLPAGTYMEGTPAYRSPEFIAKVVHALDRAGKLPDNIRRMLDA